jgi:hypothetical protein
MLAAMTSLATLARIARAELLRRGRRAEATAAYYARSKRSDGPSRPRS